jgi:ParB-like chromosome segregation protein Spo0J
MRINKQIASSFRQLTDDEFDTLLASIEKHGVLTPVIVWDEENTLVDGHHRVAIAEELGIEYPVKRMHFDDIDAAINFADRLQAGRRNESKEDRDERIRKMRAAGKSYREIAKIAGVSVGTVHNVAKEIDVFNVEHVTGRDGKLYPAHKPRQAQDDEDAPPIDEAPPVDVAKQKQEARRAAIQRRKQEYIEASARSLNGNSPTIYITDAIDFMAASDEDSIDLLFTDPPYSTDVSDIDGFVRDWLPPALRMLKRTGRAFIFIGAYPRELSAYLDFLLHEQTKFIVDAPLVWTYKNTLGVTPKMRYNLNYQAILHLYTADSAPLDTSVTGEMFSVHAINAPDGRQGDRVFKWQKPDELAMRLIAHAANVGDVVFDPFAGSGSLLIAAAKMKKKAFGCEFESAHAEIAEARGCHAIHS